MTLPPPITVISYDEWVAKGSPYNTPFSIDIEPYNYPYPLILIVTMAWITPYAVYQSGRWQYWWTMAYEDRPPPPFGNGPLRDSGGVPTDPSEPSDPTPVGVGELRTTQVYLEVIAAAGDGVNGYALITEEDDATAIYSVDGIVGQAFIDESDDVIDIRTYGEITGTVSIDDDDYIEIAISEIVLLNPVFTDETTDYFVLTDESYNFYLRATDDFNIIDIHEEDDVLSIDAREVGIYIVEDDDVTYFDARDTSIDVLEEDDELEVLAVSSQSIQIYEEDDEIEFSIRVYGKRKRRSLTVTMTRM